MYTVYSSLPNSQGVVGGGWWIGHDFKWCKSIDGNKNNPQCSRLRGERGGGGGPMTGIYTPTS